MEYLDIVDEKGNPTGEIVERTLAHAEGIRHRTSHVWLMRKRGDRTEILLQKRAQGKDSHPGCYDISSAGHIPAGVDFLSSALRELEEELGLAAEPEELIDLGIRASFHESVFYDKNFCDNQVCKVYVLWRDVEPEGLQLQQEEVESVRWMTFADFTAAIRENQIPHCVSLDEVDMLEKYLWLCESLTL